MSKIHYSNISSKAPLNTNKITNELIEILYELLPNKFSHWSLKFAQSKSNHRQIHDASIWLDKLQVYVGLPDWMLTEEQMLSEQLPIPKVPVWPLRKPLRRHREQFELSSSRQQAL